MGSVPAGRYTDGDSARAGDPKPKQPTSENRMANHGSPLQKVTGRVKGGPYPQRPADAI